MRVAILRTALVAVAFVAAPVLADQISLNKTAVVVSDPVGSPAPKSLPGAVVDYRILANNPVAYALTPVKNLVLTDILPTTVKLRVSDIGVAGKGPVEFLDGNLLGAGLTGSGLAYVYTSNANPNDGLEFYDGTSWTYTPVADADGYDANVRGIRVTLGTTFTTTTSFQLRYRVMIK